MQNLTKYSVFSSVLSLLEVGSHFRVLLSSSQGCRLTTIFRLIGEAIARNKFANKGLFTREAGEGDGDGAATGGVAV